MPGKPPAVDSADAKSIFWRIESLELCVKVQTLFMAGSNASWNSPWSSIGAVIAPLVLLAGARIAAGPGATPAELS